MPTFIDTHAHIHDDDFDDAPVAIARACEAGVAAIVTLGVNARNSERAVAFAERNDGVLAAAGVHPHDAKDATDADLDALEALAEHPRVVMVGEIGLDYYRDLSPRDVQRRVLARQLATAARLAKPVAVHGREAYDDVLDMLAAWSRTLGGKMPDGGPLGVLHYFAGDVAQAQEFIALGFLISIHTSVTHSKALQLQSVARETPLDALVIETDSPYGAPQRYRGKRNEPAYVVEAAHKVAELRGISVEVLAGATSANAIRLLRIPSATAGGTQA